jgi:Vps54-like protein
MVPATQEMLILLIDYLKVIVNLSLLTSGTMSRIIEFPKAFNSRTYQVVLGAGAMRSAGFKNVIAKHLTLTSWSLSIVIALIPCVCGTFRRHFSQKQSSYSCSCAITRSTSHKAGSGHGGPSHSTYQEFEHDQVGRSLGLRARIDSTKP